MKCSVGSKMLLRSPLLEDKFLDYLGFVKGSPSVMGTHFVYIRCLVDKGPGSI